MYPQVVGGGECLAALDALVGVGDVVHLFGVGVEVGLLAEGGLAVVGGRAQQAPERLLLVVHHAHVLHQVGLGARLVVAHLAFVWFFFPVDRDDVFVEMCLLAESGEADVAFEPLLLLVHRSHVFVEEAFGGGAIDALLALVGTALDVHGVDVRVHVHLLPETRLAQMALERTLLVVHYPDVLVQHAFVSTAVFAHDTLIGPLPNVDIFQMGFQMDLLGESLLAVGTLERPEFLVGKWMRVIATASATRFAIVSATAASAAVSASAASAAAVSATATAPLMCLHLLLGYQQILLVNVCLGVCAVNVPYVVDHSSLVDVAEATNVTSRSGKLAHVQHGGRRNSRAAGSAAAATVGPSPVMIAAVMGGHGRQGVQTRCTARWLATPNPQRRVNRGVEMRVHAVARHFHSKIGPIHKHYSSHYVLYYVKCPNYS